jgi:putative peptidoglycan lipid II flippase
VNAAADGPTDLPIEPHQLAAGSALVEDSRLARDAIVVTVCTLLSRVTGFGRVLVAAAVLGTGLLGDTYHAANIVPNLLFELVAGGVLQAVLLPSFVAARRNGGDQELGRTAGVMVAALTLVLAIIVLAGMAAAPFLARALTGLEDDPAVAADKLSIMTPMLLVFIPQVVFYGIGMVATAALSARRKFAAAALAPAVNNLVVITCYLLYRASRHGRPASLDLNAWQFALLAGGTTLAVIVFTAVPGIVLSAQGVSWRPSWQPRHPAIVALRSSVGWAMLSVVGTLVPTGAAVVLGYGEEGGVAVFTLAFAFFVLPHALVAVPVATTLAPRVAESWQRDDRDQTRGLIDKASLVVLPTLCFAGAAMLALAWPIADIVRSLGQAGSQGAGPIAHTLAVFGPGLVGYGMAFVMTRVLFSLNDVRRAALLVTCSAAIGVVGMVVASHVIADSERAAALALGYGLTQAVSAVLITMRVRQLTGVPSWTSLGRLGLGSVGAAAVSGVAMALVESPFGTSRWSSIVSVAVAGTVGAAVFAAAVTVLAGVSPSTLIRRTVTP